MSWVSLGIAARIVVESVERSRAAGCVTSTRRGFFAPVCETEAGKRTGREVRLGGVHPIPARVRSVRRC